MALQTHGTATSASFIDALTLDQAGDATFYNDIKMPSGGVLNWDGGDVMITESANTLTLGGGDLALGANNLTTTGTITTPASITTTVLSVGDPASNTIIGIDSMAYVGGG